MAELDTPTVLRRVMADDHGRLLSALIGQLRDFQLAEDCLQEAMASALEHWDRSGVPRQPAGWLLQVARRKAIDRLRHAHMANRQGADYDYLMRLDQVEAGEVHEIPDERLRLIFTCCHPALDPKTRVALTLRTLGGLTTAEIAHAFLDTESAMAQRLVRARHKIARARVPYEVPGRELWPERLPPVLTVIYLIFNEGYAASHGDVQIRRDLCAEALFLARLIKQLCPNEPEVEGLLALILLIDARRDARQTTQGRMIALEDQDRGLWDQAAIADGAKLVEAALQRGQPGPFQIKAAIQAVHDTAASFDATDWAEVLGLYDLLTRLEDTPVTWLNRAVALAHLNGPDAGLKALEPLRSALQDYAPFFATEADFLARCKQWEQAVAAYERAISLTDAGTERGFLTRRLERAKKEAEQKLGLSPTGR